MNEISGNLQVLARLGSKPDLAAAKAAFAKAAAEMGIAYGACQIDNAGRTLRIRAQDVTGITDVDTPVTAEFTPSARVLTIKIARHPGGFEAAAEMSGRLAERLAAAFGLQLGQGTAKPKRRCACAAAIPAVGPASPVVTIAADFTPH